MYLPNKVTTAFFVLLATLYCASYCFAAEGQLQTVQQAQQVLFGEGTYFKPYPLNLDDDTVDAIEDQADVRLKLKRIKAWQVSTVTGQNAWFFVDQVIGKHEFITYAVAIDHQGQVKGIEILEYLETHGGQIQQASWRKQFLNMNLIGHQIKLGKDIDGISGATLSCRNVTDGVRKLLVLSAYLSKNTV